MTTTHKTPNRSKTFTVKATRSADGRRGFKILRGTGKAATMVKPRYHSGCFRHKADADMVAYHLRKG